MLIEGTKSVILSDLEFKERHPRIPTEPFEPLTDLCSRMTDFPHLFIETLVIVPYVVSKLFYI